MAVYNVELFLKDAIESLISQSIGFEHIQLILTDDGSTDNSGMICDEYAVRFPQNIIVLHQENAGVSAARNAALPHVRGKYVNFMDARKDIWHDVIALKGLIIKRVCRLCR